jgi:hypothetical protein
LYVKGQFAHFRKISPEWLGIGFPVGKWEDLNVVETGQLLIFSDVHYAGPSERLRKDYEIRGVKKFWPRMVLRFFRRFVWLKDPFAHNYLFDRILERRGEPELVVGNGDFSCDSGFVGLADTAARESAAECLGKARARFGERFVAVVGDHELGKTSLAGGNGGLRLESWERTRDLGIEPFWMRRSGQFVLIGVTSSLLALEVYGHDALPEEMPEWERVRREHLERVREAFAGVKREERIILFCHDPTGLPFLGAESFAQEKLCQIERTVIGHLHTPLVYWKSRMLAGFPAVNCLGTGIRRISRGLNRARLWKPFRILMCPSPSGSQLLKDGGYYEADLKGDEARFQFRPLKWEPR